MFDKLKAFVNLFRKGSEVANVEAWKNRQITGTLIGGLILAIINVAEIYGIKLPVDAESANAIGVGIVGVANVLLTASTSKRAGLLPALERSDDTSDTSSDTGMQNPRISDDTREKALQYVAKTETELFGNLDTTYSPR